MFFTATFSLQGLGIWYCKDLVWNNTFNGEHRWEFEDKQKLSDLREFYEYENNIIKLLKFWHLRYTAPLLDYAFYRQGFTVIAAEAQDRPVDVNINFILTHWKWNWM